MAARINNRHQEMIRDKIRASQLVNVLENHALGERELSATQITAALGLLKKVVPDLKAVELDANVVGEMQVTIVKFGDATPEQLDT